MNYLAVHHTAGRQNVKSPQEVGGNHEFYNVLITPFAVFRQHKELHDRGGIKTYDVCLSGDFTKVEPTAYQLTQLNAIIKEFNLPVCQHRDLARLGATKNTIARTACPGSLLTHMPFIFNILVEHYGEDPSIEFEKARNFILSHSDGRISLKMTYKPSNLVGTVLGTDDMLKLSYGLSGYHCAYYIYKSTQTNRPWHMTSYNPASNCALVSDPYPGSWETIVFELLHAMAKYYQGNRGSAPSYSNEDLLDWNVDFVINKIKELTTLLPLLESVKTMTEKEVRQLQALEGYKDEAGVAYWTGKPLSAYLTARLEDKVKTINELNNE